MADKRVQMAEPTPEQLAMLERIRAVLSGKPARERRLAAVPHVPERRLTAVASS